MKRDLLFLLLIMSSPLAAYRLHFENHTFEQITVKLSDGRFPNVAWQQELGPYDSISPKTQKPLWKLSSILTDFQILEIYRNGEEVVYENAHVAAVYNQPNSDEWNVLICENDGEIEIEFETTPVDPNRSPVSKKTSNTNNADVLTELWEIFSSCWKHRKID